MRRIRKFLQFVWGSVLIALRGNWVYYLWLLFLLVLIGLGGFAYYRQVKYGLITTAMRDSVSWAFYIGQFTFLAGIALAAVTVVIPAYVYDWKPLKEVVILAELLAISALIMCFLFVLVDVGRPDRVWHMIPLIGYLNLPRSMLAWDFVVLNAYFILNFIIVTYLVYKAFFQEAPKREIYLPLVFLSIPAAIAIQTAFLYNGLSARPFWNSALLAPRLTVSAFCSGPAILVILFQILQKTENLEIRKEAIWKIAELMAYAALINLYFFGAEIFKEYYSDTQHLVHYKFLFQGIGEHNSVVPYAWLSFFCNLIACVLLLIPATRKNFITLNLGCVLLYAASYIEKGIALLLPGFIPGPLGEVYEYFPTANEILVSMGIFAIGFLAFTLMVKVAVEVTTGRFTYESLKNGSVEEKKE